MSLRAHHADVMGLRIRVLALMAAVAWLAMPASLSQEHLTAATPPAVAYYVDSNYGWDGGRGTSPTTAWRTLDRANRQTYRGGDSLLLRGGETFAGTLKLDAHNLYATSPRLRLTISSYGVGRATIAPARYADGIIILNRTGVSISDLLIVNGETDGNCQYRKQNPGAPDGIHVDVTTRLGGNGVTVQNTEVSGFCNGIYIDPTVNRVGHISNIWIDKTYVHDNGNAGVEADMDGYIHDRSTYNIVVTHVLAVRNHNDGGIVLWGVRRGIIEDSVALSNADYITYDKKGKPTGGGIGIQAENSDHIIIQHTESAYNGSPILTDDGDGYDFDSGVQDSVMRDNYSHDNNGIGYLIEANDAHNITLRNNRSLNDGHSRQNSGLYINDASGPTSNITITGNTFDESGSAVSSIPIIGIDPFAASQISFTHNTIRSHGQPMTNVDPRDFSSFVFAANSWHATRGRAHFLWAGKWYRSTQKWRQATGYS